MRIYEKNHLIHIDLKENNFKARKALWICLFALYGFISVVCFMLFGPLIYESIINIPYQDFNIGMVILLGVLIAVTIFYPLLTYQFLRLAFSFEQLVISKESLFLNKNQVFQKSSSVFDIRKIQNFRFIDKEYRLGDHPLKGNHIDQFGFETMDKVVEQAHRLDKIAFEYENKTITFGKNIFSWDFELIEEKIFGKTEQLDN